MLIMAVACAVFTQLQLPAEPQPLAFTEGLVVESRGEWGRRAVNTDLVVQRVVDGELAWPGAPVPSAGDRLIPGDESSPAWEVIAATEADGQHRFDVPGGRYILTTVRSDRERVMVLDASGHAMVYVNGEPRVGDPYGAGYVQLPVLLREGENTFLFASAGRGPVRAVLRGRDDAGTQPWLEFNDRDITAPDVIKSDVYALGLPVMNATKTWQEVRVVTTTRTSTESVMHEASEPVTSKVFRLPPLSVTKLPLRCDTAYAEGGAVEVRAALRNPAQPEAAPALTEITFKLACVAPSQTHKRTFVSEIDGSVQYYAVVPPAPGAAAPPGLVLSLHGASVEAINQARSYSAKPDFVIVCPTNRRPFGFDWEDWGRLDAFEVMEDAEHAFGTDPRRQYLTGHSMGGHGTWQLGTLFPERFAAIAPSAGWLSFDSYAQSGGATAERAAAIRKGLHPSSLTDTRLENLRGRAVYILHGDADDNVPAAEAERAAEKLSELGIPYEMHTQPGAGHWWDDDRPGAACVDWPPIFEMFRAHALPEHAAERKPDPALAHRAMPAGSFKRVFDREFLLVCGTVGTPQENAWALAKARFDAEQWWYRGNGYAEIVTDTSLTNRDIINRNVVFYGKWDTEHVRTIADRPVNLETDHRARHVGFMLDAPLPTGDAATLALIGPDDPLAHTHLAAFMTGGSLRAMRALDRVPIFSSGAFIPERFVFTPEIWTKGKEAVTEQSGKAEDWQGGG
ncbi:MAG TPA: prolyl oligopeptidase family serine peptidase [Phycisphaerales bacterium]|nr:prolyl oligopeptidase family serine peptidase [Phycisphaerales bacterium]